MKKKLLKFISILSLIAILFAFGTIGSQATVSEAYGEVSALGCTDCQCSSSLRISKKVNTEQLKNLRLYVGGMPFGVKFLTEGVIVVGFNDQSTKNPSIAAGIRPNDVILKVNGKQIRSALELNDTVSASKGKRLELLCSREGKEFTVNVTPVYSEAEGRYSIGIKVRDSGAGIGTITFICPESQAFGGLGHGICDAETGRLIPMQRGSVVGVKINGIVKGLSGAPGEVRGYFNSGKTGTLLGNTDCGVYGVLASIPSTVHGEPMSLGLRECVKEGKAYLYTMLDGERVEKYEIEISEIERDSMTNKCFTVKVTDKRLIDKTGGIIQGMSGSPIVQDGKLIGAVTHVLINDPTTGYGIFIENMLNAAQMPMAKAS